MFYSVDLIKLWVCVRNGRTLFEGQEIDWTCSLSSLSNLLPWVHDTGGISLEDSGHGVVEKRTKLPPEEGQEVEDYHDP